MGSVILSLMKRFAYLVCLCFAASAADLHPRFVRAVHMVESGGRIGRIVGDGGRALGPFQIHKSYWQDAVNSNKSIGGRYEDCADYKYSLKVISAYLNKYAPKEVETNKFETLARIHNGGPRGNSNKNTLGYWNKIKKNLK